MNRRLNSLTAALLAATLLGGCAMNGRQEALEVRLREHESTIRDLRSQITKAERTLVEQDQELLAERSRDRRNSDADSPNDAFLTSGVTQATFTPEVKAAWGSVDSIRIHRLTSGVIQGDEESGRTLNVVVQSLDSDGELVKTAGPLTLTVSVVAADGTTQQIAHNSYSITECRRLWVRSLVAPGFHMQVPLTGESSAVPTVNDRILVTATFELGHNRNFSTSQLLDVSL
ncbi:MAG: hypothetical protein GY758_20330 [Fuerstiella sp.]|nr:hypothetical protein [Fuerstiella sp.]